MGMRCRIWMAVLGKAGCRQHRSLRGRGIARWPWFRGWLRRCDSLEMALVTFVHRLVSFDAVWKPIGRWRIRSRMVGRADARRWRSTHSDSIQQRRPAAHDCHPSRPVHWPPSGTVSRGAANTIPFRGVHPDTWPRRSCRFGVDFHLVHRCLVATVFDRRNR